MNNKLKKSLIISIIIFSVLIIILLSTLLNQFSYSKNKGPIEKNKSEQLILGFSQIGSESAWRTRNTQSIFEAASENNIQILYL